MQGSDRRDLQLAMTKADMDFHVVARELMTHDEDHVPDRKALFRTDTNEYLGTVGMNYAVASNPQVFACLAPLVHEGPWDIDRAGNFLGGKRSWMLLTQREKHTDEGGYNPKGVDMNLLASTSHDGSAALRVTVTPYRPFCSNFLATAISESQSSVRISHIPSWSRKMDLIVDFITRIPKLTAQCLDQYMLLHHTAVLADQLEEFIATLPLSEIAAKKVFASMRRNPPDHSFWDLYNLYNSRLNHKYQNKSRSMNSLWFGQRHTRDVAALNTLLQIAS